MYRLFTDKQEILEASVQLEGISISNTICRVVVETETHNLVFDGTITESTCKVPINALRGVLEENATGNMYLEIIADGVYFKPWESTYKVVTDKKVTVEVTHTKKKNIRPRVSADIVIKESTPEIHVIKPRASGKTLIKNTFLELKEEGMLGMLTDFYVREHLETKYPNDKIPQHVIDMVLKLAEHVSK